MTNLQALKNIFPNDYKKFSATVEWLNEEYTPHDPTIFEVFNYMFNDPEGVVSTTQSIWNKKYEGDLFI